ncbi:MAG: hypothetical protein NTW87_11825 [Planctomycetota bacterium]|nr:hypothetical protein [Planctomycetota bacterium]
MGLYLERHRAGKAFHDPLAAAVAVNPAICQFMEVEVRRQDKGWGAWPKPGCGTWISVAVNREAFVNTLLLGETGSE